MLRTRVITGLLATATLAMAAPATVPAKTSHKGKHCVKFKTHSKNGKSYKRCAKYSK